MDLSESDDGVLGHNDIILPDLKKYYRFKLFMERNIQNTALENISKTAFKREIAAYRGDLEILDESKNIFNRDVEVALIMGHSDLDINKAELIGRLKVAMEEGREKEADLYRNSLMDLDENL